MVVLEKGCYVAPDAISNDDCEAMQQGYEAGGMATTIDSGALAARLFTSRCCNTCLCTGLLSLSTIT